MITDWISHYDSLKKMTPAMLEGLWQEEEEGQYWEMLECVPPIQYKDNTFMVGECATHSEYGAIYDAHVKVDGRYFWRPALLQTFNPAKYRREIRAKFEQGD